MPEFAHQLGRVLSSDIKNKPFAHTMIVGGMAVAIVAGILGFGPLAATATVAMFGGLLAAFVAERE